MALVSVNTIAQLVHSPWEDDWDSITQYIAQDNATVVSHRVHQWRKERKGAHGETMLHLCAAHNAVECTAMLLKQEFSPIVPNREGNCNTFT